MYFSLGASALLSEAVLQIFTGIYLGRTLRFAAQNRFYSTRIYDKLVVSNGKSAMVMYVGAIIWFISVFGAIAQIIWTFFGFGKIVKDWYARSGIKRTQDEAVQRTTDRFERGLMVQAARRTESLFAAWARYSVKLGLQYHVVPQGRLQETAAQEDGSDLQLEEQKTATLQLSSEPYNARSEPAWLLALRRMGLSKESLLHMNQVVLWMIPPFIVGYGHAVRKIEI